MIGSQSIFFVADVHEKSTGFYQDNVKKIKTPSILMLVTRTVNGISGVNKIRIRWNGNVDKSHFFGHPQC